MNTNYDIEHNDEMSQNIVLFTDAEPDDMLAISVLAARGFKCVLCVVGEGNPIEKAARVGTYITAANLWHDDEHVLITGCASSKLFPGETAVHDGYVFDIAAFHETLKRVVETHGVTTVVCLKPPRELLAYCKHMPEGTAILSTLHLAIYGSFNVRQLTAAGAARNDLAAMLLNADETPFASVIVYESYGGTAEGHSNINPTTCPSFFANARPGLLSTDMEVWDADILRDCDESCAAAEASGDKESWKRNNSCRVAVRANLNRQFVAADPVLAALLHNETAESYLTPVSIDFGTTPYPAIIISRPPSGKVRKFVNVPWAVVSDVLAVVPWV